MFGKKPALDVIVGIGKKPAKMGAEKPPALDVPSKSAHDEPDADQTGGASDDDADNQPAEGEHDVVKYAQEIAGAPGGAELLAALCNFIKKDDAEDAGY